MNSSPNRTLAQAQRMHTLSRAADIEQHRFLHNSKSFSDFFAIALRSQTEESVSFLAKAPARAILRVIFTLGYAVSGAVC